MIPLIAMQSTRMRAAALYVLLVLGLTGLAESARADAPAVVRPEASTSVDAAAVDHAIDAAAVDGGKKPEAPPAAPAAHYTSTLIRRNEEPPSADGATPVASSSKPTSATSEIARILVALGAVIGLIFFLRWGSKRLFVLPGAAGSNGAVQVLSRAPLSPKQSVLVLRVGRRVLVVGDSGGQMSPLCEITEPDEVAALMGQLRTQKESPAVKTFSALFNRVRRPFDGSTTEADEEAAPIDDAPADGLRINLLGGDERTHAGDFESDDNDDELTEDSNRSAKASEAPDPESADGEAVVVPREDLDGLMERVRRVSKQFQKL